MRAFVIILFLFVSQSLAGQKTIIIDTIFERFSDSKISIIEEHQKFLKTLELKDLINTKDSFAIRIREAGSVFELTVDSNGRKNYKYINYSWKFKKKLWDGELLFKYNNLSQDSVKLIFQNLIFKRIDTILQTDRNIWENPWKGNSYYIEISTNSFYKFIMLNQSFEDCALCNMNPGKEFMAINDFLIFTRYKINFNDHLSRFQKSLPSGKYSTGHGWFINYDN